MCGSGSQRKHATGPGLEPRCLTLQVVFVLVVVVPTAHRPPSRPFEFDNSPISVSQRVESSLCWEVIDLWALPSDQLWLSTPL